MDRIARQLGDGPNEYAPTTANTWLKLLKVIVNEAVAEYELPRNPVTGLKPFDTSTHETYTDEEPNALTPEEVPVFLAELERRFPQHFAMVVLGFATGLRPSTLRPLRREGPAADVLWDDGVLLVRRSNTVGEEVMQKPKTGRRQRLALPPVLMEILRWHAARLPDGPMKDSELLFPSDTGGFRARSCLTRPFQVVGSAIGLKKAITAKGMRRTFQDLARAAAVSDIVTRSISGHATEAMQRHYSTVAVEEMRQAISNVASVAGLRAKEKAANSDEVPMGNASSKGAA